MNWRLPGWWPALAPAASVALVVLINALGLLLVGRRLAGALEDSPPLPLTAVLAVGAMVAAGLARMAVGPQTHPAWLVRGVGYGASLGLVLIVAGCWPSQSLHEWVVWMPVLVVDQFWRQHFLDRIPGVWEGYGENAAEPERLAEWEQAAVEQPPSEVVQQQFRVRDESGVEVVYATAVAEFAPEQRNATVHLGFCPPLEYTPRVEADPVDFPEARVGKVVAYPHGVRLEVRLTQPAEEACRVVIDLVAEPTST